MASGPFPALAFPRRMTAAASTPADPAPESPLRTLMDLRMLPGNPGDAAPSTADPENDPIRSKVDAE